MKSLKIPAYVFLALALFFIYAPIAVMMLMGFNQSRINQFPFEFDLVWFEALLHNERLLQGTGNSLLIAATSSVIATAVGTLAALAMRGIRRRTRAFLNLLLIPPITIPWLILAVALLLMFFWLRVDRSLLTLMLGHVTLQIPYTVLIVSTQYVTISSNYEDAAASLGASPFRIFGWVILPLIIPSVVAAFAFSFAISFDNFVVSYFLAPSGFSTLPVEIYTAIRTGFTPEINAVSTIVFFASILLVLPAARYLRFNF